MKPPLGFPWPIWKKLKHPQQKAVRLVVRDHPLYIITGSHRFTPEEAGECLDLAIAVDRKDSLEGRLRLAFWENAGAHHDPGSGVQTMAAWRKDNVCVILIFDRTMGDRFATVNAFIEANLKTLGLANKEKRNKFFGLVLNEHRFSSRRDESRTRG